MALWPRGAAWGTPDGMAASFDTILAGFTRGLLSPFADLYARAFGLTLESRALTIVDSLADWERDFGLPDRCTSGAQSTGARRAALLSKVRSAATITPLDFVRLAYDEGFRIEIEEPAMFECGFSQCGGEHTVGDVMQEVYWIVHVYDLPIFYFRVGEGELGSDPLFEIGDLDRLKCIFARLTPAWSRPVYVVHDIS